ncbi:potassium channel family protein [Roseomonas sp. GCM10028921]
MGPSKLGDRVRILRGRRTGLSHLRASIRRLYESDASSAHRFRYAVLAFDLGTILFVIMASFMERSVGLEAVDVIIGLLLALEIAARTFASRKPLAEISHPVSLADIVAAASFIAPLLTEGFAFLRVLRTLRLVHSYRTLARLRQDFSTFRRHEEIAVASLNLVIFLFVTTGIVYETQHRLHPGISSYTDALYFTVTTLTTTGYGDITLQGHTGRLLSVAIMLCGVTLFVRLAQVIFRPQKVHFSCPSCGLQRHDPDAVHCKACGVVLCIPDDGSL